MEDNIYVIITAIILGIALIIIVVGFVLVGWGTIGQNFTPAYKASKHQKHKDREYRGWKIAFVGFLLALIFIVPYKIYEIVKML